MRLKAFIVISLYVSTTVNLVPAHVTLPKQVNLHADVKMELRVK